MVDMIDFIGEIYEASYRPKHWQQVIKTLCEKILDAKSGAIFIEDYRHNTRTMLGCYGLPKAVATAYRLGMSRYDYTFQLQKLAPVGEALQVIDAAAIKAEHPNYFRFILKPNDIGFISAMNIYNDDESHVGIGLHRSFDAKPFSAKDLSVLQKLYPHFQRSLRICQHIDALEQRQQTLQSAIDNFSIAMVLVNASGKVVYSNPVANALFTFHGALSLVKGEVCAFYDNENKALRSMINDVANLDKRDVRSVKNSMGVNHPNKDMPLIVMASGLQETQIEAYQQPKENCVALYFMDTEASAQVSVEAL